MSPADLPRLTRPRRGVARIISVDQMINNITERCTKQLCITMYSRIYSSSKNILNKLFHLEWSISFSTLIMTKFTQLFSNGYFSRMYYLMHTDIKQF